MADNLNESLISKESETAEKSPDSKQQIGSAVIDLQETPVVELSDKAKAQNHLRKSFEDIKTSVFDSFTFKNMKLPFECSTIKVSNIHNILIGARVESGEIAIQDLKSGAPPKIINTQGGEVSCIRFNVEESLVFIGTTSGKIEQFDFPSFSLESKKVFEIGDSYVAFDFIDGTLYAATNDSRHVKRINVEDGDTKIIGRCEEITYVRASKDNSHVAVCNDDQVIIYSRELKWTEFVLNLRTDEEKENDDDYYYNEKTCEIEFTNSGDAIGISYENYIMIFKANP